MGVWFCRYAVDSRTDAGRYVIEPPEVGAALVGMSISAGEVGGVSEGDVGAILQQTADERRAGSALCWGTVRDLSLKRRRRPDDR